MLVETKYLDLSTKQIFTKTEDISCIEKVNEDGDICHYIHPTTGKLHREDGPAIERASGSKEWYLNGKRHRLDGPAVEYPSGRKEWWVNGLPHREDGPAVEEPNWVYAWFLNGERHRLDGPAVEYSDGDTEWWVNGLLHRLEGPAVEWSSGSKEWWINGMRDWSNDQSALDNYPEYSVHVDEALGDSSVSSFHTCRPSYNGNWIINSGEVGNLGIGPIQRVHIDYSQIPQQTEHLQIMQYQEYAEELDRLISTFNQGLEQEMARFISMHENSAIQELRARLNGEVGIGNIGYSFSMAPLSTVPRTSYLHAMGVLGAVAGSSTVLTNNPIEDGENG